MSKKLMIVWGMVIFLLCFTIFVLGFREKDINYIKLNGNIKIATYKYINKSNLDLSIGTSSIVYTDELIKDGYLSKNKQDDIDKYCVNDIVIFKKIIGYDISINKNCDKK